MTGNKFLQYNYRDSDGIRKPNIENDPDTPEIPEVSTELPSTIARAEEPVASQGIDRYTRVKQYRMDNINEAILNTPKEAEVTSNIETAPKTVLKGNLTGSEEYENA